MFIPIPIVPMTTTRVINKTIIYSDTVLNLKDVGSNLKINSISNVSEFEIENCLNTVFDTNKDVTFNTIQYSKNNNKIYFYTDKDINIDKWKDSKIFKYKPLNNKIEILEELKRLFNSKKIKDPNIVSLSQVLKTVYEKNKKYDFEINTFENRLDERLKNKYSDSSYSVLYDFDYDNNFMQVGFKEYDWEEVFEVTFSKNNNDLYIIKSESINANDYLVELGNILSDLYDKYIENRQFKQEYNYNITAVNSNFNVDISSDALRLFNKNYEFVLNNYISREYNYDCNSYELIDYIKGNEKKLFDKIYINISDCPKWMQEELKQVRYEELVNEDRLEKIAEEKKRLEELDRQLKEQRKQKILAFKKKIFPWIK